MTTEFVDQLRHIPWFANIGKPIVNSADVKQIFSWSEWPGPEDESVMEIHTRQQSLYETIFAKAGQQREAAKNLWNNIHTIVFHYASKNVPYDPTEDAWHAPSTAVWQAAWTAGLVGVCRMLNQDIPDDLEQQWRWFQEGHWPCALENENGNKHVVVY